MLAIVVSAAAFAQTPVDPARVRDLLQRFESRPHEELRCEVIPIKPALNFSFRFQAGFYVHVPMNQTDDADAQRGVGRRARRLSE